MDFEEILFKRINPLPLLTFQNHSLMKYKQKLGDDLSVCVLNLHASVGTLPGLLAITLVI